MKIITKILTLTMIVSLTFSGCMSTNNLNDLTVVQALGIDTFEGQTKVTLQYLDINKSGTATDALDGSITTCATGVAMNITDAISTAAKSLSQKIFLGQNKIIIFGSEYSNIGLDKGLDYLIRSIDSRPDVLVAMSATSGEDIVRNDQNGCRIPAQNVYKLLELGEDNGLGAVVSVNDLLNLYEDATTDVYLPVIKSNEDGVSCEGVVCFSDEKVAVQLDKYYTNGFLFLKDRISGGTLTVTNNEFGLIGVDVVKSKSKPSAKIVDDKIIFECKLNVDILLSELERGSTSDLTVDKIREIENLVKLKIDDMCVGAFNTCVRANSDPYAIGKYLAKSDIRSYKKLKNQWHSNLDKVEIVMDTQVRLKNINDNSLRK